MKLAVNVFFILFFIIPLGCNSQDMDIPQLKTYKYLALGDSYTIGEGVQETERFPLQLQDSLFKSGIALDGVRIIARTGWTTDELMQAVDQENITDTFQLVTLLIGVNNQYRGHTAESYRPGFTDLLCKAVSFAGGVPEKVIVISIPDWGVTPFAQGRDREQIAREIDEFNAVNLEETKRVGAHYVDVTGISREASARSELLAGDQLHPSGLMYAEWVEKLTPIASKILKEIP